MINWIHLPNHTHTKLTDDPVSVFVPQFLCFGFIILPFIFFGSGPNGTESQSFIYLFILPWGSESSSKIQLLGWYKLM